MSATGTTAYAIQPGRCAIVSIYSLLNIFYPLAAAGPARRLDRSSGEL
jgi:hypothetical protein